MIDTLHSALPDRKTVRGRILDWQSAPLITDDAMQAWQGLLDARKLYESDAFFSPRLSDLPNPDAMKDLPTAADRLADALLGDEHIHVFGDFDADGVCGTAILVEALRGVGAQVSYSIPHRADDGHGISPDSVRQAQASGCTLGISVDTGTSCFDACTVAVEVGFDLIITDHHLPEDTLPSAFALLNPARNDCGFAKRCLCGTGVAFFLLMAVWKRLKAAGKSTLFDLRQLLDRVAVATVADVMELVGVNRILVYQGLLRLNSNPSTGMAALIGMANARGKPISTETIGFYLAPRINAAGRMRHGEEAMRMLSTQDSAEATQLAELLDETNKQRRMVESTTYKQAEEKLAGTDILAIYDEAWHAGVVGLVAGKLSRKHGQPAAVGFVDRDANIRVSLRGQQGFHIGDLLHSCAAHLTGFGGHAGAGGGTVKTGQWDAFVHAFGHAVMAQSEQAGSAHRQTVDGILGLNALHIGLATRLQRFEPFGHGNAACTWLLKDVQILNRRDLKGRVLRLQISDGVHRVNAVVFGAGVMDEVLQPGATCTLLGQLQADTWQGNGAVQFIVQDAIAKTNP